MMTGLISGGANSSPCLRPTAYRTSFRTHFDLLAAFDQNNNTISDSSICRYRLRSHRSPGSRSSTSWKVRTPTVGRTYTSVPGPDCDTSGRRRAQPDDQSRADPPAAIDFKTQWAARNHGGAIGTRWCCPAASGLPRPVPLNPTTGRAGPRAAMPMPAGPGRDVPCSEAGCGRILLPPRCHEDQKV
jgi:hypothetical protein